MILRNLLASACLIAGLGSATGVAMAQPAAPAAAAYSTTDTDIGTLLDNAQTKAVIDKHLPQFSANPQIAMARSMTLQQIKSFAGDMLTDETLAKIDADLAKIPKTR
jgi:hypothetical protein